ncbi:MAG: hypothetical protein GOP50_06085 [Candidatus Heimdallarchaeota archaeon]|nr:hypothetical protein [Candidatus Heimdallarchaeota archaeon]
MNENNDKERLNYFIVDSTAIMHHFVLDGRLKENDFLIIPELLEIELKSFESKSVLTILEAEGKLIRATPSSESLERIIEIAKKSGDYGALSKIDTQVLALALDFSDSVIYSDDNAVQNVSAFLKIKVVSQHFSIRHKREYYWKCTVCGSKFSQESKTCIDCGSPVKRFFKRK